MNPVVWVFPTVLYVIVALFVWMHDDIHRYPVEPARSFFWPLFAVRGLIRSLKRAWKE